ncbi:sensor histidine kinase [Microvirga sp. KLBC 81]|uniref:sensor histidine kinase n=1 Tax=Microvirga sp. KLBC 81 TaxID=1862707 RepID=UPI001402C225|nr:HWE histidine kinase domain-containing protein [Microvirga sp. KLBC 81]
MDRSVQARIGARLSELLEGIGDAFYSLDREWRFSYINRAAEVYFGTGRGEMLGRMIWDVFPSSVGTELRRRYEEVAATGIATSFETDAVGVPGRFLEVHVFPYNGGLGISFRDWTERRRAEIELRESQARLTSLADNVPACMVYQIDDAADYRDRKLLYISKTCERLNGIPAEEVQANLSLLYELVLPQYRDRMLAKEVEAVREHKAFDMEFEMRHGRTGEVRWHRLVVTPRQLANGSYVWDGLQIDITDHKRAEEHLRLLVNELNHRVKNTLATVQSLAAQSFSRLGSHVDDDLRAARNAFEARLFALARGHDVLTRENWEGANLSDVLAEACAAHRANATECMRIAIEGPDLRVSPPMALSLSMTLHELFTNAHKYGALSNSSGQIRISWSTPTASSGQRLIMRWEERGGPPVKPPARKGFGSRLIQDGLARELNGVVHLHYEPTGVVCTMDVPLS